MKFRLQIWATILWKVGKVHRKQTENTMENIIKELESMKAFVYLGVVEDSRYIGYTHEKGKLDE
jgi:hypothetical protein